MQRSPPSGTSPGPPRQTDRTLRATASRLPEHRWVPPSYHLMSCLPALSPVSPAMAMAMQPLPATAAVPLIARTATCLPCLLCSADERPTLMRTRAGCDRQAAFLTAPLHRQRRHAHNSWRTARQPARSQHGNQVALRFSTGAPLAAGRHPLKMKGLLEICGFCLFGRPQSRAEDRGRHRRAVRVDTRSLSMQAIAITRSG